MNESSSFPKIPGYRIEGKLGEGGMATVYLAHEEKLDRKVALKVLELISDKGKDLALRFQKEARTAAGLHHANIVPIFDVGQHDHFYYMAVEFFPGGTLKEWILSGISDPDQARSILGQMARALDYAHRKGFIHRDIKPDNIMFREEGTAVLTDFGIARAVGSTTKLTKTGMSIGTPHYMSPEQARGKTLDGRSDLYSLGIVFYEMLTGKVPFDAEDSIAIAVKHIQEPIPTLPAHLSPYQPLLNKLLAKDPADRFQTGSELEREVEGQRSEGQRSKSDSPGYGSRITDHDSHPNPESRIPNHGFSDQPASSGDYAGSRRSKVEGQMSRSDSPPVTRHVSPNPESRIPNPVPPGHPSKRTRLVQQKPSSENHRMETFGWLFTIIAVAVVIVVIGVTQEVRNRNKRENNTWRESCSINTVQSYQDYLIAYPSGKYKTEAQQRKRWREDEIRKIEEQRKQAARIAAARQFAARQEQARLEAEQKRKEAALLAEKRRKDQALLAERMAEAQRLARKQSESLLEMKTSRYTQGNESFGKQNVVYSIGLWSLFHNSKGDVIIWYQTGDLAVEIVRDSNGWWHLKKGESFTVVYPASGSQDDSTFYDRPWRKTFNQGNSVAPGASFSINGKHGVTTFRVTGSAIDITMCDQNQLSIPENMPKVVLKNKWKETYIYSR